MQEHMPVLKSGGIRDQEIAYHIVAGLGVEISAEPVRIYMLFTET